MLTLSHLLASHTHLAQPSFMPPLSALALRSRLSLYNAARPVCNIVPYNMSKELPPYMSMSTSEKSATQSKPTLRMLLLGKPCCGKGTLAARLSEKYDVLTISTGDLLRHHIAERTDVGRKAEGIVAAGGLLPDEMMLDLITTKLDTLKENNWILDGFPRTQRQGRMLDNLLAKHNIPLNLIVNVDVSDDLLFQWLSNRSVHLPSGRTYSTSYNPPKIPGLDDITGEPLTKRSDDNPETFARRLEHYYAQTSPLLYYYASRAHSTRLVDLSGDSDTVWPTLEKATRESFPGVRERVLPGSRLRLGPPQVRLALHSSLAIADGVYTS
ncbi:adenylate kinase-domain-containing protein [Boletus edulis BED1]|uniref:Adenylate kinase-domain-containing protein n=1 Tax=Boletus edulis BED1 TaxID=1328754 RepID=A0AAD4C4U8_BOLED|nr:adenylate kinase-domain-containing protein [Boletus edulis BED1]